MSTFIRKPTRRHDGRYREETFVPHAPPRQITAGLTPLLPDNDTKSSTPCVIDGGAIEPFDNGSADFRYIAYTADEANGLRVTYSDDLSAWENEAAVTGFTGTSNACYPVLCVDLKEALTSRKTAAKTLFYINLAGSGSARLRKLTINNDNNKTGTGDVATGSTVVGGSGEWNQVLAGLCYGRIDSNAPNMGAPSQYTIFLIGMFYDGTSEYSVGAIYGATFDTLSVKKIQVKADVAANSADGFFMAVPLTRELGMFHSLQDFKGIPVLLRGNVSGVGSRISLGVCMDGFNSIKELGNSFINSQVNPYKSGNLIGPSFLYREGQTNPYWFLRGTLVGANTSQFATEFIGFGEDAWEDGMAYQYDVDTPETVYGANGAVYRKRHKTATVTLSGATTTVTGFIPAGACNYLLTGKCITTTTGATSSEIGNGTDADLFGTLIGLTTTAVIGPTTVTADLPRINPAAVDVVFTANGSNYTGGAWRLDLVYWEATPPTS